MSYRVINPTHCETDEQVSKKIQEILMDENPDVIFPTGYAPAFLGVYFNPELEKYGAVYSENKILDILVGEFRHDAEPGDDLELMAREFYEYNILGSGFSSHAMPLYILTA